MKKFFRLTKRLSFLLALCAVLFVGCKQGQGGGTNNPNPTPNPNPNPDPKPPHKEGELPFTVQDIPFKMVKIPGCTEPQRLGTEGYELRFVTLSPFYMLESEVTQELYLAVMGENPSKFTDSDLEEGEEQMKRPVDSVSWINAVIFCNTLTTALMGEEECVYDITGGPAEKSNVKIIFNSEGKIDRKGFRLPSESEWEWASRGGAYHVPQYIGPTLPDKDFEGMDNLTGQEWSDKYIELVKKYRAVISEYAWVGKAAGKKTHEVKKKKPNPYKLYDMGGNVYEWCFDTLGKYEDSEGNGYPDYIKKGEKVPENIVFHDYFGPKPTEVGMNEVLKGGSFFSPVPTNPDYAISHATCDYRAGSSANSTANYVGFRIVCSVLNEE